MTPLDRYRQLTIEIRRYNVEDAVAIERWQLQRFNQVWKSALENNPFYSEWAREHGLPDEISDVGELRSFPLLAKSDLVAKQDFVFRNLHGVTSAVTGGSTGQPARFPIGKDEDKARWASQYAGRSWWGISPTSKLALVWGHSHLYGSGMTRVANLVKRRLKDIVSRTKRFDAYLDSEVQSRRQLDEILKFRPEYIVGYASALERLARVSTDRQVDQLSRLNLKGVIATAETLESNGARALHDAFRCPVLIEYGTAEFGVAAYSRYQTWNLQALWGSFLLLRTRDNELVVTTIADKAFPLINYATGDIVKVKDETRSGSIVTLESIQGRKQEIVTMSGRDGSPISMSAIQPVHILKGEPEVIGIQFEQRDGDALVVHVKLTNPGALDRIVRNFHRHIVHDYPGIDLRTVSFVEANHLELTTAGKVKLFR